MCDEEKCRIMGSGGSAMPIAGVAVRLQSNRVQTNQPHDACKEFEDIVILTLLLLLLHLLCRC
jgi:hypothetical protein